MQNGLAIGHRSRSSKAGTNVRHSHIVAAFVGFLCSGAVRAHEIGTTRVSIAFQEGHTYDDEIVTDATALAEKLESSPGSDFDEKYHQRDKLAYEGTKVTP